MPPVHRPDPSRPMTSVVHPRRRAARSNDPSPSLIDSFQNMSLCRGHTFNDSTKLGTWDPLESPTVPKAARSPTCPKSLNDLLLGAGERRAVELLQRVDEAIATQSKLALGALLSEPEVLPLPTFMVADRPERGPTDKARPGLRRHSHSSDSGIGSSVADSDAASLSAKIADENVDESTTSSVTTVTEERGLSEYASRQIHRHIVEPILREQALQDFHPLIERVPEQIGNKNIKTLRELEKTLIFLAPESSRTAHTYLRFCERTIRVLHTTVTTLHVSDQRAPTDRPYTQGYFLDLVEQIRRYAQILAVTRQRPEHGETADEMDASPGESISIHGGMTHNGKPAELVRHTKDGKCISLATGQVLSSEELSTSSTKRPMPADLVDVDDDALRSMARRKKGAKPEIHECPVDGCDKDFKRPCDLTKHIKTHERPWKCPESTCKYHTHGWPTEKERDRHINDKHSAAPPEYGCLFEGCPYRSKRESNCKQHMEKAHGWEYVRSKSNGKGKVNKSVTRLPHGSVSASPGSAMLTPLTPIAPSPSTHSWASSRESMPPPTGVAGPSNFATPAFTHPSPDFAGHFNMNFDFNNMSHPWPTPEMSDDQHFSTSGSSLSGIQLDGDVSFEDDTSPHRLSFDDFNAYGFQNFGFDGPSPQATAGAPYHGHSTDARPDGTDLPHTSPGAQLEQTFTAPSTDCDPAMDLDAGFGDFTLFNDAQAPSAAGQMIPSLPVGGSSWGNLGSQFDFAPPSLPGGTTALMEELFPELKQ